MSRDLRFLVNQSIAGGVIGKGGENIKEIRNTTGAGVKVRARLKRIEYENITSTSSFEKG